MKKRSYRMTVTFCELKFNDPDMNFEMWDCDQKGIQCEYCIIKERYETKLRINEK